MSKAPAAASHDELGPGLLLGKSKTYDPDGKTKSIPDAHPKCESGRPSRQL